MSEFKPCPFCGKEPQVVTMPDGEVHVYDGTSRGCPMSAGWTSPEKWNTRPIEDALQSRIAELEALLAAYVGHPGIMDDLRKMSDEQDKRIAELTMPEEVRFIAVACITRVIGEHKLDVNDSREAKALDWLKGAK